MTERMKSIKALVVGAVELNERMKRIESLCNMHCMMMEADDEEIYYDWITVGVPDEPSKYDIESIADNENDYNEVRRVFANLLHSYIEDNRMKQSEVEYMVQRAEAEAIKFKKNLYEMAGISL